MSFKWGDSKISARPLKISDERAISALARKVEVGEDDFVTAYSFAEFQVASVTEGEQVVPPVTRHDDSDTITASFEVWDNLPRPFLAKWRAEMTGAETDSKNG